MGEYLYTVVLASVFICVILCLSPDGDGGKVGRYVAFIGALVIAAVLFKPLSGFISEGVSDLESTSFQTTADIGEEETGEYMAKSVGTAFSKIYNVPLSNIRAKVAFSDSGELQRIILTVDTKGNANWDEAEKILSDVYKASVEIENG